MNDVRHDYLQNDEGGKKRYEKHSDYVFDGLIDGNSEKYANAVKADSH